MTALTQPPIYATAVFAENKPGAMLSITPLAAATTFHAQAGRIYTADGRELLILDSEARGRVADALARDQASVFVVETGPLGFVQDYAIEPARSL
ncbi:hypothetical protein ACWV27_26565 (plasmid) [Massilia varians]